MGLRYRAGISRDALASLTALALLPTLWALPAPASAEAQSRPRDDLFAVDGEAPERSPFVAVAAQAGPAVVSIRTERSVTGGDVDTGPMERMYRRFFPADQGDPFSRPGSGTGFVVTSAGHIVTNNHVIARADAVKVRFSGDRREYPAEIVGADPASDLAVLRVDPAACPEPLVFADSDLVAVGDWALAVGNPFGNLEGSLTVGVVSATGRSDLVIAGGAPRYQDFLQTDAPINFGNSGGPLLDISGRVIGVNTAIKTDSEGIGFAIPGNFARRVCGQLIASGRVVRGFLGARAVDADGGGARLAEVLPGSPAAAAGLLPGDVVMRLGDRRIGGQRDLLFAVSDLPVGETVGCRVGRDGDLLDLEVVLVESGSADAAAEGAWRGLATADAVGDDPRVEKLRDALGIASGPGAMIVGIVPGSPAERAGLAPGDVIAAVEERRVEDRAGFLAAVGEAAGGGGVRLLVLSGGERKYVEVEPGSPGRLR